MEGKSLLNELYVELKEKFENTKEVVEDNDLNDNELIEKFKNESFEELIQDYKKKYNKLKEEVSNIKKQEIKIEQEKLLKKAYKIIYGNELITDEEKLEVTNEEKEKIIEEKQRVENILKILEGKSTYNSGIADDIKNLKLL